MRMINKNITIILIVLVVFVISCNNDDDETNEYGFTSGFGSKIEYCHTGGYDVLTSGMIIGYFTRISFDNYLEEYQQIFQDDSILYKLNDTKKIAENLIDTLDTVFEQSGYFTFLGSLPILTESAIIYGSSTSTYYAYRNNIDDTLKTLTVQNGVINGYFPDEYLVFAELFNSTLTKIYESNP